MGARATGVVETELRQGAAGCGMRELEELHTQLALRVQAVEDSSLSEVGTSAAQLPQTSGFDTALAASTATTMVCTQHPVATASAHLQTVVAPSMPLASFAPASSTCALLRHLYQQAGHLTVLLPASSEWHQG